MALTEEAVVYDRIELVPAERANLHGVPLTLEQVNAVVAFAYKSANDNGLDYPDWGRAKQVFTSNYQVAEGGRGWTQKQTEPAQNAAPAQATPNNNATQPKPKA